MERKPLWILCFCRGFEDTFGHQCFESSGTALAAVLSVAISALQWSELNFLCQQLFQAALLEGAVEGQRCGHVILVASLSCHKQAALMLGTGWVVSTLLNCSTS